MIYFSAHLFFFLLLFLLSQGSVEEFNRVNVDGAVHVMNEAIDSGARSFTHISTGNVLLGSPHLNNCDEVELLCLYTS